MADFSAIKQTLDDNITTNGTQDITGGILNTCLDGMLDAVNEKKGDSVSLAPNWAASTAYAVGDLVTYNGALYECSTAHTSGTSWASTNWTAKSVKERLAAQAVTVSQNTSTGGYDLAIGGTTAIESINAGKWKDTTSVDYSSQVSVTGQYIHSSGSILTDASYCISTPIAVSKGDIVVMRSLLQSANACAIALCDEDGTIVHPVVLGGESSDEYNYTYICDEDGYVMVCGRPAYKNLHIEKNATLATAGNRIGIAGKYGNNIWLTNPDATNICMEKLYLGVPRQQIYNAFRSVRISGWDSSVKRSIGYIWNNYSDNFRLILLAYDSTTSAWIRCWDSGNISISTINPTGDGVITYEATQNSVTLECVIDMSMIPTGGGSAFNTTPELYFSGMCYESSGIDSSTFVKTTAQSFTTAQQLQARTNINAVANEVTFPKRMFPNAQLPCVSFQFDDIPDNDDLVVSLFDSLGVRCNFAFIASTSNVSAKGQKYLALNKRGYGICSHSVDSTIFNTTNYTRDTAIAALQASKNRLEQIGMVINGFVSPSSQMASDFLDLVQMTYGYAFTSSDGESGRTGNPCRCVRQSMESSTLDYAKGRIDNAIAWGYNVTFYGHAANFGNTIGTEVWNIAKLQSLVEYAIEKRDAGQIFLGNTDDCFNYYYGGNPYNVQLSGAIGTILPITNHHYYCKNVTSGTISYDASRTAECDMFITTASTYQSGALTFGTGYKFNETPVIGASETWYLKFVQGCIIATKLA